MKNISLNKYRPKSSNYRHAITEYNINNNISSKKLNNSLYKG